MSRSVASRPDARDSATGAPGWAVIEAIRPTQITVGFREVADKRRRRREALAAGRAGFPRNPVPVVIGLGGQPFALDRHHWLKALFDDGVRKVRVVVVDDLDGQDEAAFWRTLDHRGWCHPFGADGRRQGHDAIPQSIAQLLDDPFRSLASALRRCGGFEKDPTLFSEFRWADYLRGHIDPRNIEHNFDNALAWAVRLSKRDGARVPAGQGSVVARPETQQTEGR
jgi:hypothetical protein